MVEPRRTGMSMSSSGSHATPRWRKVDSNCRSRREGEAARRAIWLLFARTYRTSGLAETGTSRIKKFTFGTAETCGVDRREGQARIVDKDVDAAEPRHRHRDDAVTIRRLAQIRDKRQDLPGNVTLSRCSIDFGDIRVDMANCNDVISLAREPEALKVLAGYS